MLIVIVIIGILAAALIPRLTGIQARARDTARTADMRNTATALEVYHLDNGSYPGANYAFIHKKSSPLLSSLFFPTTFAQTPGGSSLDKIDASLASYMTALPKDPNGMWVQANIGGDCLVQWSSYAYYTDPVGWLYAITATKESKRGNAATCGDKIDKAGDGAYEKVGKGLINDISLPPTDENCFEPRPFEGTITAYITTCPKDVVIPSTIWGVPVTSLWYRSFHQIDSVIIPNSVKRIEWHAFNNDNNLKTITIPNSVTYIGDAAFEKNKLTTVYFPDSIVTIDGDPLDRNFWLTNVSIWKSTNITSLRNWQYAISRVPLCSIANWCITIRQ